MPKDINPFEIAAEMLAKGNDIAKDRPTKPRHAPGARVVRSIFLSDIHLGSNSCRADEVMAFLQTHAADTIYLVGDIFDVWRPMGANWKPSHHAVLELLLQRAHDGVRIVYTPGNHDAFFRRYFGHYFKAIEVADYVYHTTADGKKMLVIHGDTCDVFERRAPVLSKIGAHCESVMLAFQMLVNRGLANAGYKDWAGMDYVLGQVNHVLRGQDMFQKRLTDLAVEHAADGIICGHFHQPALHSDHGVVYANCGDWTENCSALVENMSGQLSLVEWGIQRQGARKAAPMVDQPVTARA